MQNYFLDAVEQALESMQAENNFRSLPQITEDDSAKLLKNTCFTNIKSLINSEKKYIFLNGRKLLNLGGNDYLGLGHESVAYAGDVNNDGIDDLIVGAFSADPGSRTGASCVSI